METVRKRILVTGKVQGVGYRALVKQLARTSGIKGYVRNLDDGSVEIYAQAPPDILESFVTQIRIKGGNNNFSVNVETISMFSESDKAFKPEKSAFKTFWVYYDEDLSAGEKEMVEKAEIGTLMLAGLDSKLGMVDSKLGGVDSKLGGIDSKLGGVDSKLGGIDSKLSDLRDETKAFRQETKGNFDELNGETSAFRHESKANFVGLKEEVSNFRHENNENLLALKGHTTDFRNETRGNFTKLDVKYDSVSGTLNKINGNLEKISTAVQKLAVKFSK